ncbi:hypothetical protein BR93DRAFT_938152 [Coniochaeta sp. PMI_546]|nr:hypothetical protein BR93DRAFT_938152 [Coniochaeta sp. PMI_546]
MAQMMGFTAFGSQAPPSKKRRYNPRADAIADSGAGGSTGGLPAKPPAPRGTGANTLPLLPRSAPCQGSGGTTLQDGGVEREQRMQAVLEDSGKDAIGSEAAGQDRSGEDPPPQYIDTSRSPVRTGEDEDSTSGPVTAPGSSDNQPASRGGRGGPGAGPHRRIWWTDYYDPSSNENPWEWLEKAKGLEPVGSWLTRGHGAHRVGGGRSG